MSKKEKEVFISGAGNEREDRFAELVAAGLVLADAYAKAGYSGKNIDQPRKHCKTPRIRNAIIYYKKIRAKRVDITDRQILLEQACIAQFSIKDILDPATDKPLAPSEITANAAKAIKKFTTKTITTRSGDEVTEYSYEMHDKQRALAELSRLKEAQKETNSSHKLVIEVKPVITIKEEKDKKE
tara:strand:- start:925 stop:1476 length:552 start_codon:yes stop_codon:yes gene_type:complete